MNKEYPGISRIKKSGFEGELAEAREALHLAAQTIAELAKREPRVAVKEKDDIRVVEVFPTGNHDLDVKNLEDALGRAGPGGVVLLKSKDRDGKAQAFNLTMVSDLSLPYEVSLKSEKDTQIIFSE